MEYDFTCQLTDLPASAEVVVTDNIYTAAKKYAIRHIRIPGAMMDEKFMVTVSFDQAQHEDGEHSAIFTGNFAMELDFDCYMVSTGKEVIDN
jgi:hypothetical protein